LRVESDLNKEQVDFVGSDRYITGVCIRTYRGFCREARRAIEQGGAAVDGEKVTDLRMTFTKADLADGKTFRIGKKNFKKVIAK